MISISQLFGQVLQPNILSLVETLSLSTELTTDTIFAKQDIELALNVETLLYPLHKLFNYYSQRKLFLKKYLQKSC